jgi:pyridoxamine 5'-phosphate oxidase
MSIKSTLKSVLTMGQGVTRGLPDSTADRDPIDLFREWFDEAEESGIMLPEATALATATADGMPSSRMVLLKAFSEDGFVFYTNYGSRKARELEANPRAALLMHWTVLQRQVRIEGQVTRLSQSESDAYFQTRGRGSRIGAWASRQSQVLDIRSDLERRVSETEERFKDQDVPLPEFWGGYRVVPERIEFWQGRVNRLHDRLIFSRAGQSWDTERLYP